jgi:hypothetical protein
MYQQAPRGGKHVIMGGQGARIHIDIYVGQGAEERTEYPRSLVPYKALYHARLHTLVPCRPTASRATTPPIAPRNATAADTRRPFRCSRPHKIAVLRSIFREGSTGGGNSSDTHVVFASLPRRVETNMDRFASSRRDGDNRPWRSRIHNAAVNGIVATHRRPNTTSTAKRHKRSKRNDIAVARIKQSKLRRQAVVGIRVVNSKNLCTRFFRSVCPKHCLKLSRYKPYGGFLHRSRGDSLASRGGAEFDDMDGELTCSSIPSLDSSRRAARFC